MPEHIHLLITEPEVGTPSTVMQVLKQRTARALLPKNKRADARQRCLFGDAIPRRALWQARFYDFNVWTTKKRVEKLRCMHRNPVKRGLVNSPEEWRWSSYRFYLLDEAGPVRVNEGWTGFVSRACGMINPRRGSIPDSRPSQKRTNAKDGAPTVLVTASEIKPGPPARDI
jgi:REP element-mobilizing transposase RayT